MLKFLLVVMLGNTLGGELVDINDGLKLFDSNSDGTQILLFFDDKQGLLSVLNVNDTSIDRLEASIYSYVKVNYTDILAGQGRYFAIAFAPTLSNTPVVACITSLGMGICQEYIGNADGYEFVQTLQSNYNSLKLDATWNEYKSGMKWSFTYGLNPKPLISGNLPAIAMYGFVDSNLNLLKPNITYSIRTGDGNTGYNPVLDSSSRPFSQAEITRNSSMLIHNITSSSITESLLKSVLLITLSCLIL